MTSNVPPSLPPIVNRPRSPTENDRSQKEQNAILHNRGLILGLLFGVTGALGLPLLWYSPVFTLKEKFLWSVANTIYTAVLVLIAFVAVWFAWSSSMRI